MWAVGGARGVARLSAGFSSTFLLAPVVREPTSEAAEALGRPPTSVSTTQRAGEPAWHRRQRRHRANARALLRVATASHLLQLHHSAMPNGSSAGKGTKAAGSGAGGKGGGKQGADRGEFMWRSGEPQPGDWDCHICGLGNNRNWRPKCRGCEALRKKSATGCGVAQARQPPIVTKEFTTAERQLQRQKQDQKEQRRRQLAANRELAAQVERLEEELAAAKKGGRRRADMGDDEGEDDAGGDGDAMDSADGYATWTEEERQRRLEQAKASLPYLSSRHGEESVEVKAAKDEIDAIQRASRDAKPFRAHRDLLERRREKLKKQQSREEDDLARLTSERDELQNRIEEATKSIGERAKMLAKIDEELNDLVKRALQENGVLEQNPPPSQAPTAAAAMAKAMEALRTMEGRPGMPPEFSAMLSQFQGIASAMVAAVEAAAPPPAPQPAQPPTTHRSSTSSTTHGDGTKGKITDGEQMSTAGGEKGALSDASAAVLAPHGRWNRPTGAAAAVEGSGSTVATGGDVQATDDDMGQSGDQELLEEEALDPSIDADVAKSISKLPTADQRRLRAALGARGGRRRSTGDGEDSGASADRDRERSPRPHKGGGTNGDDL